MSKVVIYGTGDVALLSHYFLTNDSPYEVVAFCLERERMTAATFLGLPLVAFEEVDGTYPPTEYRMMVGVGFQRVNHLRSEIYQQAKAKGYAFSSYVSSSSTTWPDLVIGDNCIIMEGNLIQPYVTIGDNVILGPGNSIGHHVRIMDHVFLASCVALSGRVTLEAHCFLGANSAVRDGVTVGEASVIGANAVVLRNTKPRDVYVSPRAERLPLTSDKLPWLTSRPGPVVR
jgi:sugar O-acyltransferase (sialic acid O-acetyltransferase NeuD family)